jgi:hypothetical protein
MVKAHLMFYLNFPTTVNRVLALQGAFALKELMAKGPDPLVVGSAARLGSGRPQSIHEQRAAEYIE